MSYMRDIPEHHSVLKRVTSGKKVVDLGCGRLVKQTLLMASWRLPEILALDKQPFSGDPFLLPRNVFYRDDYFCDVDPSDLEGYDVGLLSWPRQYNLDGLEALLKVLPTVVYVGKNTDGSGCGTELLWEHFRRRPVLEYHPHLQNTMIVYGPYDLSARRTEAQLYHEEICGADKQQMHSYTDDPLGK